MKTQVEITTIIIMKYRNWSGIAQGVEIIITVLTDLV